MGSKDMNVVAYKIMRYLYLCTTRDEDVDEEMIMPGSPLLGDIGRRYWVRILSQLDEKGLVKGISIMWFDNEATVTMSDPYVTLEGCDYLQESRGFARAARFMNKAKAAAPFA